MNINTIFGKFENLPLVASYTLHTHLSADAMKHVSFENNEIRIQNTTDVAGEEEITHEDFFGENINRVKNALRSK